MLDIIARKKNSSFKFDQKNMTKSQVALFQKNMNKDV